MKKLLNVVDKTNIDQLYSKASIHIDKARRTVQKSINEEMIRAYWLIGRDIFETEQQRQKKAEYGKSILKGLSAKLQAKYKSGFSVDTLEKARKFYLTYQSDFDQLQKSATLSRKSIALASAEVSNSKAGEFFFLTPNLSWSHYVELIKVSRVEAREFYAIEANKNNWNVRELRRQIDSFLYDRLSKAKNKNLILKEACRGHEINTPEDAIKEPLVLEFLGAPEPHKLSETELETALINNLQDFLLELGKGFAFVKRQKRITFDNSHYYCDLVFYHTILKCYVIVDIKIKPVSHGDLGQMLLYVNYFDKEIKMKNDNPTIGLVLCTAKHDGMVKYLLDEKAKQIFASTYQFHLPSEKELEIELRREISTIEYQKLTDK